MKYVKFLHTKYKMLLKFLVKYMQYFCQNQFKTKILVFEKTSVDSVIKYIVIHV